MKVRAFESYLFDGVDLLIYKGGALEGYVVQMVYDDPKAQEVHDGEIRAPSMRLDSDTARNLLDALIAAGVKPSVNVDLEGAELRAVKYHLEDMRLLAKVRR